MGEGVCVESYGIGRVEPSVNMHQVLVNIESKVYKF